MSKATQRKALGRGLSNLIPTDSEELGSNDNIVSVAIDAIVPNPFQPRTYFNDEEIAGLAESIKNQGLLQPIVLRKKNSTYEIISGERRFRALKKLEYDKVPAIVKAKVTDREMLEMAIVENIQREELSEIEKAVAYQQLLLKCGLSHEQLSERVGKSRSAITNTIRLLKLPEEIQAMVRTGAISMGHARALLSIDDADKQLALAKRIISETLTVRDVENGGQPAKQQKGPAQPTAQKQSSTPQDPEITHIAEQLQYHLGTQVSLQLSDSGKGKIEISFFNKEDLDRVLGVLLK